MNAKSEAEAVQLNEMKHEKWELKGKGVQEQPATYGPGHGMGNSRQVRMRDTRRGKVVYTRECPLPLARRRRQSYRYEKAPVFLNFSLLCVRVLWHFLLDLTWESQRRGEWLFTFSLSWESRLYEILKYDIKFNKFIRVSANRKKTGNLHI